MFPLRILPILSVDILMVNSKNTTATCNDDSGADGAFDQPISPSYRFTTVNFEAEYQFIAYENELSAFGRAKLPEGKSYDAGFHGERIGYVLNGIGVAIGASDAYSFARSHQSLASTYGDNWVVILRKKGQAHIDIDGSTFRYEGDRLEVRHQGEPRSGRLSNHESVFLYLPRERFAGMENILDDLASAEPRHRIHPMLSHYLSSLARVLPDLRPDDVAEAANATVALVKACTNYSPDAIAAAQSPVMLSLFEMARKYIDANLRSPDLSADSLRKFLCISRRQLYNVFEKHGGVDSYIRVRSLNACHRAILASNGEKSIALIAEQYGFMHPARFSRAFRTQFGCSASELRQFAKAKVKPTRYEEWLLSNFSSDRR